MLHFCGPLPFLSFHSLYVFSWASLLFALTCASGRLGLGKKRRSAGARGWCQGEGCQGEPVTRILRQRGQHLVPGPNPPPRGREVWQRSFLCKMAKRWEIFEGFSLVAHMQEFGPITQFLKVKNDKKKVRFRLFFESEGPAGLGWFRGRASQYFEPGPDIFGKPAYLPPPVHITIPVFSWQLKLFSLPGSPPFLSLQFYTLWFVCSPVIQLSRMWHPTTRHQLLETPVQLWSRTWTTRYGAVKPHTQFSPLWFLISFLNDYKINQRFWFLFSSKVQKIPRILCVEMEMDSTEMDGHRHRMNSCSCFDDTKARLGVDLGN